MVHGAVGGGVLCGEHVSRGAHTRQLWRAHAPGPPAVATEREREHHGAQPGGEPRLHERLGSKLGRNDRAGDELLDAQARGDLGGEDELQQVPLDDAVAADVEPRAQAVRPALLLDPCERGVAAVGATPATTERGDELSVIGGN